VQVKRWCRYGFDRLYVTDSDGRKIGWWDLADDSGHPEEPENDPLLVKAVMVWRTSAGSPAAKETAAGGPAPSRTDESMRTALLPPRTLNASITPGERIPSPAMTIVDYPPPDGAAEVVDLFFNRPGQQLIGKVEAARQAGERPTLWRRFWLGKYAYSTWERGMIGEQLVAQELVKLVGKDSRWWYLTSIPVGVDVDVDAFVVGPGGVFTINAKYHRGSRVWVGGDTMMINGARQPYVRNSRHEARKAAKLLSRATGEQIPVRGIVVPVAASSFTVREQPTDVHVINRARLIRYLRSLPEAFDPAAVQRVFNAARISTTWMPSA
jgi:Nuclease-related domain